jgi:hypothetical protein
MGQGRTLLPFYLSDATEEFHKDVVVRDRPHIDLHTRSLSIDAKAGREHQSRTRFLGGKRPHWCPNKPIRGDGAEPRVPHVVSIDHRLTIALQKASVPLRAGGRDHCSVQPVCLVGRKLSVLKRLEVYAFTSPSHPHTARFLFAPLFSLTKKAHTRLNEVAKKLSRRRGR